MVIYVLRNTVTRSCNHCWSRKGVSIIYSECVFVALGNQNATRIRHIVTCGLSSSTILFTLSHKRHDFRKKNKYLVQNYVGFDFLYKVSLKYFSFYEEMREIWPKKYIGLHISTRFSCQILMRLEFSLLLFEENSHVKFNGNPSSGSRVVLCGRTDRKTDGEKNMTELIGAFRNVAKTHKLCGTMRLFSIWFMLHSRREHRGNREQNYCPCRW